MIGSAHARDQRSQLRYFVAAHGTNGTLRMDRRVIDRWLVSIGHLAQSSRRGHVSTVKNFLAWAVTEGYVEARILDLLPRVKVPRSVPRALSHDQVVQLLGVLRSDRQRVVVGLMIWCGLRCAEVADAKVEDVDEHAGTLFVKGKGGSERVLCLPDEFMPILDRWLNRRHRVPGPLVVTSAGARFAPETISRMVSLLMIEAGVKVAPRDGRSAHALRHTCASDVLDRGASITTVQALLGHQHLATTATYLRRARLEDLRAAMNGRTYKTETEGAA